MGPHSEPAGRILDGNSPAKRILIDKEIEIAGAFVNVSKTFEGSFLPNLLRRRFSLGGELLV